VVSQVDAWLLGLVQGLTEFLPVSSSGHLVLAQHLLGVTPASGILFEVCLHLATLVAIVLFYRRRVTALVIGLKSAEPAAWRYVSKLVLATLPAVFAALLARSWIEQQFNSLLAVGICLLVTGCVVWSTRYTVTGGHAEEPGWRAALAIGVVQAIAILPGISRSGSTVAAGMALGLKPLAAAEFSFLLGIIAIAGAGVLLLPELGAIDAGAFDAILAGGVTALLSGLLALWAFVWLLRSQRFHLFAWYAWLVGGATIIISLA
jgi:undecaprenyl-diphosphatase